jgi:crotonobetainyl-CoA:carnitine CoA-transferase CaiB-like acyl-CoA transferase
MNYLTTGKAPLRMGNAHPNIVPYQDFPTADGAMILAVGNDGQFAKLALVAGHPEWAASSVFATNKARVKNRVALVKAFTAVSVTRTTKAWIAALEAAGVPCGPINTLAEVFADPQVVARGTKITMPHGAGAEVSLVANPIRMSETPPEYRTAPPRLGQHTRSVLTERLGLDEAAIAALVEHGVI